AAARFALGHRATPRMAAAPGAGTASELPAAVLAAATGVDAGGAVTRFAGRAAAALVAAFILIPAAAAGNASPAQVASLASRARSDPHALAALRQIDRIDGRPVDLASALHAHGPELD